MEERNEYEIFIPKMVDLGLPSGTLWADRNVGAEKPENYGDYFRFGEAEPFTKQSPKYNWRAFRDGIESTDLDAATVHFNRKCHTPTFAQIKELIYNCHQEWTELNGINGIQVTGPNGNSIFFPASGYRDCLSRNLKNVGLYGFYRSSTPINHFSSYRLTFANSEWSYDSILFLNGYSVRAVAEEFE